MESVTHPHASGSEHEYLLPAFLGSGRRTMPALILAVSVRIPAPRAGMNITFAQKRARLVAQRGRR